MAVIFKHTFIYLIFAYLGACGPVVRRSAALPPVVQSSSEVTNATLLSYPWPIVRDGGGGGTVAGIHIINYSDTQTQNEDDFKAFGFYPFVSNSIVTTSAVGCTMNKVP
jgi:hypothetical protein